MKKIIKKIDPTHLMKLNEASKKFNIARTSILYYIRRGYIKAYSIPSKVKAIDIDELKALRNKISNKYKI